MIIKSSEVRDYVYLSFHWGLMEYYKKIKRSGSRLLILYAGVVAKIVLVGIVYSQVLNKTPDDYMPYFMNGFALWTLMSSCFVSSSAINEKYDVFYRQFNVPWVVYVSKTLIAEFMLYTPLVLIVILSTLYFYHIQNIYLYIIKSIIYFVLFSVSISCVSYLISYLGILIKNFTLAFSSLMQLMFLLTPVLWAPNFTADIEGGWFYLFNPMYHFLALYRIGVGVEDGLLGLSGGVVLCISILSLCFVGIVSYLLSTRGNA